jgi:hypothetical protein
MNKLESIFERADTDHDKRLTAAELVQRLATVLSSESMTVALGQDEVELLHVYFEQQQGRTELSVEEFAALVSEASRGNFDQFKARQQIAALMRHLPREGSDENMSRAAFVSMVYEALGRI